MAHTPYIRDDSKYMSYYINQAGGDLPGFIGSSTQYGRGVGGVFGSLFRMIAPLFRTGFKLVKPHLKTAARHIAGTVITKLADHALSDKQEGSGLMVYTPRPRKRPPSTRKTPAPKRRKVTTKARKVTRKRSTSSGSRAVKRRSVIARDIF